MKICNNSKDNFTVFINQKNEQLLGKVFLPLERLDCTSLINGNPRDYTVNIFNNGKHVKELIPTDTGMDVILLSSPVTGFPNVKVYLASENAKEKCIDMLMNQSIEYSATKEQVTFIKECWVEFKSKWPECFCHLKPQAHFEILYCELKEKIDQKMTVIQAWCALKKHHNFPLNMPISRDFLERHLEISGEYYLVL